MSHKKRPLEFTTSEPKTRKPKEQRKEGPLPRGQQSSRNNGGSEKTFFRYASRSEEIVPRFMQQNQNSQAPPPAPRQQVPPSWVKSVSFSLGGGRGLALSSKQPDPVEKEIALLYKILPSDDFWFPLSSAFRCISLGLSQYHKMSRTDFRVNTRFLFESGIEQPDLTCTSDKLHQHSQELDLDVGFQFNFPDIEFPFQSERFPHRKY